MTPESDRLEEQDELSQARRTLLEDGALAASKQWVDSWRADLRKQGRRAEGGWPGTLAEARAHVIAYFAAELHRRKMAALTHAELTWAAKAAYAAAKRDWRSTSLPEGY